MPNSSTERVRTALLRKHSASKKRVGIELERVTRGLTTATTRQPRGAAERPIATLFSSISSNFRNLRSRIHLSPRPTERCGVHPINRSTGLASRQDR